MKITHLAFLLFAFGSLLISSCEEEDMGIIIEEPATYAFERAGVSTVDFSGQTTRIEMGEELISGLLDFSATKDLLLERYSNQSESGGDVDPFTDSELNASTKSIRSKVAASTDFFATNTAGSAVVKEQFASWITAQVEEVFTNRNVLAAPGQAGQIADGTAARYVNAQGLEYNQAINKGLIGALMVDQMLNNYLSTAVLDAGDNRTKNDNNTTVEGQPYTDMEHKWDEAYGYLYGTAANAADPNLALGEADNFLNKYLGRMENDLDFKGIADDIFNAFKLGRAAIVAGEYRLRDEQARIIREQISTIIGVRVVYYLQQAKAALEASPANYGTAFHDLSEGYGFIYSLQFTRRPDSNAPYFSSTEVDGFLQDLMNDGPNGLWEVTPATLDAISNAIADKFPFTLAEAAE